MKQIVKDIFSILNKQEKNKLIRLILLDVLISLLDVLFLVLLLYIINFYTTNGQTLNLPFIAILDLHKYPLLPMAAFFVLFAIKNFFGFFVFRLQYRFMYSVASRLSENNLRSYLDGSYSDYVNIDSAVHTRRISHEPIEFCHYVLGGYHQIVGQSILILITIVAILIYNPILFPLLLVVLAPPVAIAGFMIKKKLASIRKTAKPVSEETLQHLKEALAGYVESNVYNQKEFFIDRYISSQSRFNKFLSDQVVVQNLPSRLIEVFAIFGLFILVVANSYTSGNAVQIITLGAFIAAAYKIIPGIVKILNSAGQMKTYRFTIKDLLKDKAIVKEENSSTSGINSIELKNVGFSYKKEDVMLKEISFSISKGEFVGMKGLSGKGKTTIINLILGFLKPENGNILINGKDTRDGERSQFWNKISYVKQQPFLIHDTILKNTTLNRKPDEQRLKEVVEATGISGFISDTPEGLNKMITENGKNISGGQRQRIVIGRALYKNSDLIILDEPFNELDRESENKLLEYFRQLAKKGKMILLITHNKESLSYCDKIVSLDAG